MFAGGHNGGVMKIKYTNGFHGYNANGEPILTDEASAAKFNNSEEAMLTVCHDGDQFGFWVGGFKLVK